MARILRIKKYLKNIMECYKTDSSYYKKIKKKNETPRVKTKNKINTSH